jgi:hypothetical protein
MLALLKVKLQPSGEYILKEAGQDMTFNQTIGPVSDAGQFYKRVASRIAELSRAGMQIKYIDHSEEDSAPGAL